MALKKGSEVEVTSDDDGFRGVWYLAKIKQAPRKRDDCFVVVEYNELVSEEDETQKLSERVHVSLVRPVAPAMSDDVVEVSDMVDVFHKDGWWVGVVEEIRSEDELLVAFDDPPDSMTVKRSDVRFHYDWMNGDWVKPKKKIKIQDSSRPAVLPVRPEKFEKQHESAKKQQPGKSCASTEKDTGVNDGIVEKVCNAEEVDISVKEVKAGSAINCETPSEKHQKSKIMDQEMHTVNDYSRPATLSGYSRRQKARAKKQQAGKRGTSTEKKITGMYDEIVEKVGDAENVDMSVKEVKGVPAKYCEAGTPLKKVQQNKSMHQEMHTVEGSCRLAMPSDQSGSCTRRSERVKQQAEKGSISTETVKGGALSAKDCKTSEKKDQKKQSTDQEITTVDSTNGSTQGDVSSKRKRGKQIGKGSMGDKRVPQRSIIKDSCVGNEAEINAESDCLRQTPVDIKSKENYVQPSNNNSLKATADENRTSGVPSQSDLLSETAVIPLPEDQVDETVPSKRVRRFKNLLLSEREGMDKLVDESLNALQGKASSPEVYRVKDLDGKLGNVNDDQISNGRLQVDKPSPTVSDSSRTLPVQRQFANANGRQDSKKDGSTPGDLPVNNFNQADKNGEVQTPATVNTDNMKNGQSLPFIKCSPLWETIESMEVYKRMAQKPHFSPLVKCVQETREGMAIAHMVNYFNIVEKTKKLLFSDPVTVIETTLETLADLESNGFDVKKIRACLTQLLSKKQIGEELQKEFQDIENEISINFNEREKVDEEIIHLNQEMKEIAAKLGDAVARKERKDSVISTLKSKQDMVGQSVQDLQLDFQNIAGSLC